ncbi:hypothetical protein [Streptomyces sp. SAI-127]|uniref:hypothetical protein n=1 Tax=Streptomyces sp. SAI-127 TaxID=2940543 RepID=UPI0024765B8D|nr:hypothetical protein [Streptomyces sp. SAI-127]
MRHDTAIGENREVLQGNRRRDGLGGQDREVPEQCGDVNGGDEDEAGLPGDVLADGGSDADADDGAEGQAADDDGHGAAAVGSPARAAATAEAEGCTEAGGGWGGEEQGEVGGCDGEVGQDEQGQGAGHEGLAGAACWWRRRGRGGQAVGEGECGDRGRRRRW